MSNEIKVTKAQKEIVMKLICDTVMGLEVEITSPEQHAMAEKLVKQGVLKITAKKNYGRIAKVRAA